MGRFTDCVWWIVLGWGELSPGYVYLHRDWTGLLFEFSIDEIDKAKIFWISCYNFKRNRVCLLNLKSSVGRCLACVVVSFWQGARRKSDAVARQLDRSS